MIQLKKNIIFAGRYKLVKQLGVGGFSEVWLAEDHMTGGTKVAVKVYVPDKGLDDIGIKQFSKEYALTEPLNHPNLLKATHFDIIVGSPYLKMTYIENGSLNRLLFEKDSFSEKEIAEIILQLSDALAYLHKQDPPVLHQDIKPDNVLIDREGNHLLTDFGISSRLRSTLRKSTTTKGAMTVAYAPPEKFGRTPKNLTEGDIFSLGVMIYELATGDVPWMGAGGVVLSNEDQIPFITDNYSIELTVLIVSCMQIQVQNRPSAKELLEAARVFVKTKKWNIDFLKDKIDIDYYKKEIEEDRQDDSILEKEVVKKKESKSNSRETVLKQRINLDTEKKERETAQLERKNSNQVENKIGLSHNKKRKRWYLALLIHLFVFGYGLYYVNPSLKRKTIYPSLYFFAIFDLILAFVFEVKPFKNDEGGVLFSVGLAIAIGIGLVDLFITLHKANRMNLSFVEDKFNVFSIIAPVVIGCILCFIFYTLY